MRKTMKQPKGKSAPIRITRETQQRIASFKARLQEMSDNDEVEENEKKVVHIVLDELTPYETNILCAYYDIAECSSTQLGNLLGISAGVAANRVKAINNKIKSKLQK